MQTLSMRSLLALLVLAGSLAPLAAAELAPYQPPGLFLTWQRDPTTTMTIDWQVDLEHGPAVSARVLHVRSAGSEEWQQADAQHLPFPHSSRSLRRVELSGLEPAHEYEFRVGGFRRIYRFRTMPAQLTEDLTFAVGGDTLHEAEWMERANRLAMSHDPAFIVWGGDLAYADGDPRKISRWYTWFHVNRRTLIHEDGRVVPVIVGIGNHEVRRGFVHAYGDDYQQNDDFRAEIAPFFFGLFAFPGQPGYGSLRFGDYLHLSLPDSDHANPIDGEQTRWLAADLATAAADGVRHIIPVYHVPAYPSVRNFENLMSQRVREHWVPLFETHGVRVAFEHHDHAYKRTPAIRAGRPDPAGITYIGDGAWGVGEREVHDPRTTWYLERAAARRHVLMLHLNQQGLRVTAIAENGDELDRVELPPSGP